MQACLLPVSLGRGGTGRATPASESKRRRLPRRTDATYRSTRPTRWARTTAWTRSRRPSFCRTCATCVFTVPSPMNSRAPISAFDSPSRHQPQHVELPRRQRLQLRRARRPRQPGEPRDHPPGHRRRQQRIPGRHRPDRVDQLLRRVVLEHEAAGAGVQRLEDVLVEVERRQHQHPRQPGRRRGSAGSPPARPAAASGCPSARPSACTRAASRTASRPSAASPTTSIPGSLRQQHPEARPHHRLVVGDQHPDGHRASTVSGNRVRSTKPPPAAGPASIDPAVDLDALPQPDQTVAAPVAGEPARGRRRRTSSSSVVRASTGRRPRRGWPARA